MSCTKITFEKIQAVADKLLAEQIAPTIEKIKDNLGNISDDENLEKLLIDWQSQSGDNLSLNQNFKLGINQELIESETNKPWAIIPLDKKIDYTQQTKLSLPTKPRVRVNLINQNEEKNLVIQEYIKQVANFKNYLDSSLSDINGKLNNLEQKNDSLQHQIVGVKNESGTNDSALQHLQQEFRAYKAGYAQNLNTYKITYANKIQNLKDTHEKQLLDYKNRHEIALKLLEEKQQQTENRLEESLVLIEQLKEERQEFLTEQLQNRQFTIDKQQAQIESITQQLNQSANNSNSSIISRTKNDTHVSLDTILAQMEQQGVMEQFKQTNEMLSQLITEQKSTRESLDEEKIDLVNKLIAADEENNRLQKLLDDAITEKIEMYNALKSIAATQMDD